MDLQLPSDVIEQLGRFDELLSELESKLQPFLGPGVKTSIAQMAPLERAGAHLALAGAAHRLFQLYLRASGVDPADHESRKEQDRLQLYTKKVRKAAAEKELRESKRSLEVNVAAVNRFISAAVPDLSQEQKAALKGAGQRGAGGAAAGAAGGTRKRKSGGGSEGAEGEEAAGEGDASGAAAAAAFLQETMEELQGQGAVPEKQQQQQEAGSGKKRRKGGA